MENPLIEFRGVVKRFGDRTILDGVDLSIYENQITTIIGKSGTGKSVLLKHIIGLLSPDEGSVLFQGKRIGEMKKGEWELYRAQISYMFQNNALFDSMTIFDNIALPLRKTTRMEKKEIEKKVMTRLEQTDLADVAERYPAEISGGMQKRAALARALVTDPKVVLFDEPTTGQDPIRKNVILSMVAQYRKKFGFTAVLISHEIPDVFFISDRIVLLWEGKAAFQGTYEESTRFHHPMIDEFLNSLEGFQDALTGLLSKQVFRSRYAVALGRGQQEETMTAVLFSVEFDLLAEALGPQAAVEVLKALGEYINTDLGALGGFSARQSSGEILTMLPHVGPHEAEILVERFGAGLQEKALCDIQALTRARIGIQACFEISVYAGVTEARSNEAIDRTIGEAKARQRIIARYQCA